MNRSASAAKSGRAEMQDKLSKNTGAGPALTAGDVDADWQSAEAVGDEAPAATTRHPTRTWSTTSAARSASSTRMTRNYRAVRRSRIAIAHRWELDPSSKDDFDDEE